MNRKWLKICFGAIGGVMLLLVAGWFVLNSYIMNHKQQILKDITHRIGQHISGTLTIKDMSPALLKSFPNVSVRLDSVCLTDSLFAKHHLKTLSLQSVYVQLNVFSLLSPHPKIRKISLSRGEIHLFTLKNGYSNSYLFQSRTEKRTKEKEHKEPDIHFFEVEEVTFIARHIPHNKLFKISCHDINLNIKEKQNGIFDIRSRLKIHVQKLSFNLSKGSYLKNSMVSGRVHLIFNSTRGLLSINKQALKVNQSEINFSGVFDFGHQAANFKLKLSSKSMKWSNGLAILPQNISGKLKVLSVENPVAVSVSVKGGFQYPDTPLVAVRLAVSDNTISSPYGTFNETSLTAYFKNQIKIGQGKGDENSGIYIQKLNGDWMGMPIKVDSASIINLLQPRLKATIEGHFPSRKLNKILGHSFAISKGTVNFNLSYEGPLNPEDTFAKQLNGFIFLKNTNLTYLPRAFSFKNCNAALVFRNNRLLIKMMRLDLGQSSFQIKGTGYHILNAYFSGSQKAYFDCYLTSPGVNLNDFKPLLKPRKKYNNNSNKERGHKISAFNKKLDVLLDKSTMRLNLVINELHYNKFKAENIKAILSLDQSGIALNHAFLNHAHGQISFDAKIRQTPQSNHFNLNAQLKGLKINELLDAFNGFGQKTLRPQNIRGVFSAKVDLTGKIKENATIASKSLNGHVDFSLKNGALNNFPPFVTISKFVFKNRNLDSITFKELADNLTIKNGNIHIPPMAILSSAILINVNGVYAFGRGTDIHLKIPLRNPQKDKKRIAKGLVPQREKGIIVYLRIKDGEDGEVHIGLDPFYKRKK